MATKYTLETVKEISNELGYEVLDKEYVNARTTMHFKCTHCGGLRNTTFDNLQRKNRCKNCDRKISNKPFNEKGRLLWSKENIQNWIQDNSNLKIIDIEGEGCHAWLNLQCPECEHIFIRKFENFKVNPTCPKCRDNPRRFTYKQIKNYIEIESNSGCKLLETEESYKQKWLKQPKMALCKIKIQCHCGEEFEESFNTFISGIKKQECNVCSIGKKNQGYTYDDVRNYIEVESNSGCKLLSTEYISYHNNLHIQCHCGSDFYRSLAVFKGTKNRDGVKECYECTGASFNPTFEDVKQDLEKNNIILHETEYINQNTKMNIEYDCGFKAYRNYANIKKSEYKCPHCVKVGYGRDTEQLTNEINDITNGEYSLLSEYKTMNDKVTIKHNKCEHVYEVTPHNFLDSGNRCPKCGNYKGEIESERVLKQFNVNYECQYSFDDLLSDFGIPLRFDFVIFNKLNELLFLLEYDGEFHYKKIYDGHDFEGQVYRDNLKNEYCKQNNIDLLRIPYWEFDNIEEILTNKLMQKGLI